MMIPRTPEGRVSLVANGFPINGSYGLPPGEALEAFRADLKELVERPTVDAYMATCRALNWRTAELRAHGVEPIALPAGATHYPPDGFNFGLPAVDDDHMRDARCIIASGLEVAGELPATAEAIEDPEADLDELERGAIRSVAMLLARADG